LLKGYPQHIGYVLHSQIKWCHHSHTEPAFRRQDEIGPPTDDYRATMLTYRADNSHEMFQVRVWMEILISHEQGDKIHYARKPFFLQGFYCRGAHFNTLGDFFYDVAVEEIKLQSAGNSLSYDASLASRLRADRNYRNLKFTYLTLL
jgi:hypothetical protein